MAAYTNISKQNFTSMDALSQSISDIPSVKVSITQQTLDHPFDVTLVVEDGKEFKAHRRVLSEASLFFEKLLNSDMKESNEGVVRLEMLSERNMRDVLEFIYTDSVQISAEDNAIELIAAADYLVLPNLKDNAEKVLEENLNTHNSISTYYLAKTYGCRKLINLSKSFICSKFAAVAKTEEFLNLPTEEVKMWISNDKIDVSAEEDVFKIILKWINQDKEERKKYFVELFREVRLAYVSRDFLQKDLVTNDLVNNNEGCMKLVRAAMKIINPSKYQHLNVKPRKSLEIPVIVVYVKGFIQEDQILCCYYPREGTWSRFRSTVPPGTQQVISCRGQVYFISQPGNSLLCYDSFSNCWTSLPYKEQRTLHKVFVGNEDDIYALVSENQISCPECVSLSFQGISPPCSKRHLSFLMKYKPETNSWEDITSFDLGSRVGICVLAKDNFIYFIGGYARDRHKTLSDVDRYDVNTDRWEKIADLQEPRTGACSSTAYGSIFIAGGLNANNKTSTTCEVYDDARKRWQFTASARKVPCVCFPFSADGKLYALDSFFNSKIIECFDPVSNLWRDVTEIPLEKFLVNPMSRHFFIVTCCSMRVFKGSRDFLQNAAFPENGCKRLM